MKKKFIRVALFGALALAAGTSFVGCNDYDDDISGLKESIETTKSDLASKEAALKASIASLESAKVNVAAVLASAKTESDKAALKAKEDAIASSLASMKAIEAELKAKIAQNATDIATDIAALNAYVLEADKKFATLAGDVDAIQKMLLGYEGLVTTVGNLQSASTILDGKITVLSDETKASIKGLQEQITVVNTQLDALDGKDATLTVKLGELLSELNTQKIALDNAATKDELATANDLITANTAKIKDLSDKIDSQLNVLKSLFRSLVTNIGFVDAVTPFNLVTADIVTTGTNAGAFGDKLVGAFKFEAGVYTSASTMLIQVSPSTANISADALTLVRTDGQSLNSDLVILEVKPNNEALTRGESKGGIWEVSVKLNPAYNKTAFEKLVKKDANLSYRFAIAVKDAGTVAEGGERIIASPYELTFPSNGNYLAMDNIDESTVGATKLGDNNQVIPVEIGTPITVKAKGDNSLYASYITIEPAGEAEAALWNTYGITGYGMVNRTNNEFELNVANIAANGKNIKFKLWTVDFINSRRDLVRTFTLACGKKNIGNPELNVTLTPDAYQANPTYNMSKAVAMTAVLAANDADAKNLVGSNVSLELKDAAGVAITGVTPTLYKKDLATAVTIGSADYKAIKEIAAVKLTGINLQKIADNGSIAGRLVFKNAAGLEIQSVPVTLTKTMPAFPSAFGAKTGLLVGGIIKVYPTFVSGAKATYEYSRIFNGIAENGGANDNYEFAFANPGTLENPNPDASNVDFNNNPAAVNAQIGVANKLVGSQGHVIATAVKYNFGQISSKKDASSVFENNWKIWGTDVSLQFASIPEESKLELAKDVVVSIAYPTEKFVLAKAKITYKNVVLESIDLGLIADAAKNAISVITLKTLSGNNTENEYYTPTIATAASATGATPAIAIGDIVFDKKSTAASLTSDVPSKLVFTITDVFGNTFDKTVNFTVKKNQ